MVVFPNAKINLGLRILRKREDGYHDLESVFVPVVYRDVLELISIPSNEPFILKQNGIAVTSDPMDNLCSKAWQLLKKDFPQLPSLTLYLHKAIPAGAGLGGGSADAAFTLKLINDYFQLGLNEDRLYAYALQLGSDCAFFITNQPAYVTGRGEHLQPITLDLSAYQILIVYPGIHVHTGKAFSLVTPSLPNESVLEIIQGPIQNWKKKLINDFETPVFKQYPALDTIKQQLYENGAIYASMSGSGSAVYGIFEKGNSPVFNFPAHYIQHWSVSQ